MTACKKGGLKGGFLVTVKMGILAWQSAHARNGLPKRPQMISILDFPDSPAANLRPKSTMTVAFSRCCFASLDWLFMIYFASAPLLVLLPPHLNNTAGLPYRRPIEYGIHSLLRYRSFWLWWRRLFTTGLIVRSFHSL